MRNLLYVAALLGGSLLPLAQPAGAAAVVVTRPHGYYYNRHYYHHPYYHHPYYYRYHYHGRGYYR
jgi:hypothetical protein